MGILTSNREMKIIMNFIEKEAIPCFIILRKDKVGKICKLAQVELNCEGYLAKEVINALLRESRDSFGANKEADKTFIQNFERKLSMRRQVMEDRINAPVIPPDDHQIPYFNPLQQENPGLTPQELQRREELARERQ